MEHVGLGSGFPGLARECNGVRCRCVLLWSALLYSELMKWKMYCRHIVLLENFA